MFKARCRDAPKADTQISFSLSPKVRCAPLLPSLGSRAPMQLSRIESGADGWQGTAWLLERLYPSRFSRPEVQISLQNTFNQTTNALSIVISKEEAQQIEQEAEKSRAKVRELFAAYRPGALNNDNGDRDQGAPPASPSHLARSSGRPGPISHVVCLPRLPAALPWQKLYPLWRFEELRSL